MFCSDPMSGSHFIVQTSKFLLIDATAVTLCQGHGKVIEYISPDPYILCAKYLRFSSNGFDVRGKSCCGGGGRGGRGGNELKTWSHPRLNNNNCNKDDDDDDNRNNNNNDNEYNHKDAKNDNNDNDKNSSDSMPATV